MSRPLGLAGHRPALAYDNFIDDGRGDDNGECVEKLMTNLK